MTIDCEGTKIVRYILFLYCHYPNSAYSSRVTPNYCSWISPEVLH